MDPPGKSPSRGSPKPVPGRNKPRSSSELPSSATKAGAKTAVATRTGGSLLPSSGANSPEASKSPTIVQVMITGNPRRVDRPAGTVAHNTNARRSYPRKSGTHGTTKTNETQIEESSKDAAKATTLSKDRSPRGDLPSPSTVKVGARKVMGLAPEVRTNLRSSTSTATTALTMSDASKRGAPSNLQSQLAAKQKSEPAQETKALGELKADKQLASATTQSRKGDRAQRERRKRQRQQHENSSKHKPEHERGMTSMKKGVQDRPQGQPLSLLQQQHRKQQAQQRDEAQNAASPVAVINVDGSKHSRHSSKGSVQEFAEALDAPVDDDIESSISGSRTASNTAGKQQTKAANTTNTCCRLVWTSLHIFLLLLGVAMALLFASGVVQLPRQNPIDEGHSKQTTTTMGRNNNYGKLAGESLNREEDGEANKNDGATTAVSSAPNNNGSAQVDTILSPPHLLQQDEETPYPSRTDDSPAMTSRPTTRQSSTLAPSTKQQPSSLPTPSPTATTSAPPPTTSPLASVAPSAVVPGDRVAFTSTAELLAAIDDYLLDGSETSVVAATYGHPIGSWNVGNITDFGYAFSSFRNDGLAANFNEELNQWDVSLATNMAGMFEGCVRFNQSLSDWNTSRVTDMTALLYNGTDFRGNISGWDVSSVNKMPFMFASAHSFDGDLSRWKVDRVDDMSSMFAGAPSFRGIGLSTWQTSAVTTMRLMFAEGTNFNGDIGSWDVANVRDTNGMFRADSEFHQDLSLWRVGRVTDMGSMFEGANKFDADLSGWEVDQVKDMSLMFANAQSFRGAGLSNWQVGNVEDMSGMFENAVSFEATTLNEWDVSKVRTMSGMFRGAERFDGPLSNWYVTSVVDASAMFASAQLFNQDLGGWQLTSVRDASMMFLDASSFRQNLCTWGEWIRINGASTVQMFEGSNCSSADEPVPPEFPVGPFCFVC